MTNYVSLTQFIFEQQRDLPDASDALSPLLKDIATACKKISHLVNRGELMNVLGIQHEPPILIFHPWQLWVVLRVYH